ncbi:uncharacterized protein TNCV_2172021 [Trichonephila clavipes]|nr:uncharacterized protein TNCV_2172021 [Trichonephila clavipes]
MVHLQAFSCLDDSIRLDGKGTTWCLPIIPGSFMVAYVRESTLEFFTLLNAKGKKELIEWCMKEGLIAWSYECPKCNDQHDVTWSAIKRFLRNRASHAECMFDHYLAE